MADPAGSPTVLDTACALSPADAEERRVAVALRLATEAPVIRAQLQTYQRTLAAAARRAQEAEDEAAKLRTLLKRVTDAAESLAREVSDPGTEALAAIHCGRNRIYG